MCSKLPIEKTEERRFTPLWYYLPTWNTFRTLLVYFFLPLKLSLYFDFKDFREENCFAFGEVMDQKIINTQITKNGDFYENLIKKTRPHLLKKSFIENFIFLAG